jgi:hypothetical protein
MAWATIPIVGKLLSGVLDLVDQGIEDKDRAAVLKAELSKAFETGDLARFTAMVEAQSKIVLGEIQGGSWLQRNWRPLLMVVIVAIIANNYLLFPYLSLFTDKVTVLELPEKLYSLMTVGVGGYIVGRSTEKGLTIWKEKQQNGP